MFFVLDDPITADDLCDPDTWTIRNASHQRTWTAGAYGNNTFVIVARAGTGNRVNRSTDGTTFSGVEAAGAAEWEGLCFAEYSGGDRFVACSTDTVSDVRFQFSTDYGASWTLATSSVNSEQWTDVTFDADNDTLIACAQSNSTLVARSTNGAVDWSSASTGVSAQPWWGIHAAGGTTIMVGDGGKVLRSTNAGTSWTDVSPGGGYDRRLKSVTYAADIARWCAVADTGGGGSTGEQIIVSDDDGLTWDEVAASSSRNWEDVCYGDGTFLAVSANNGADDDDVMIGMAGGDTWEDRALSTAADTSDDWRTCMVGDFSGTSIFAVAGTGSGMGPSELGQIQTSVC